MGSIKLNVLPLVSLVSVTDCTEHHQGTLTYSPAPFLPFSLPITHLACLQSSAVETQTARVQMLKREAATGKVSVDKLEQQQSVLSKMTVSASSPCIMHVPLPCRVINNDQ